MGEGTDPRGTHAARGSALRTAVGAVAILVFVGTAGVVGDRWPETVGRDGAATATSDGLALAAGTVVSLGEGKTVVVRAAGTFEIGLGDRAAPAALVRVGSDRLHLVDADGNVIGAASGAVVPRGGAVWLRCGGTIEAGTDTRPGDRAPVAKRGACGAPLSAWVRALSPTDVRAVDVDGTAVPIGPRAYAANAGAVALVLGLVGALVLGPAALWPLAAAPLAFVAPLPAPAFLALLLGGAGAARGGPRGWAAAAAGLGFAAFAVVGAAERTDEGDAAVARALAPTVTTALFERKVDEAVAANAGAVRAAGRPLIVVLGGSSSGGGTPGRFWPQILQDLLGTRATVVSLAWGGATTWHLRRILDRLDVRADVCVLYVGHNDTTASVPGRSIADVEAGVATHAPGLMPPVSLAEARANVTAIGSRCARVLALQERVRGRDTVMNAYAAMLRDTPGVTWADGAAIVRPEHLLDDVHLHPAGHAAFARAIHTTVSEWLP